MTRDQVNQITNRIDKTKVNNKVPQMPENSVFMMNDKFYPKPMVQLADAEIAKETKEKFDRLLTEFDDIVSKHSSNTGKTPLETRTIDVKPELVTAAGRPYDTSLKNQEFLRQELRALLESGVIERSMSPYAAPVIIVHRKCKLGTPLKEQKHLVIDYRKLNRQLLMAETAQNKSKGLLPLIPTPKIEHIWHTLRSAKYLSAIDLRSGYHHIPIAKKTTIKVLLYVNMVSSSLKEQVLAYQHAQIISNP